MQLGLFRAASMASAQATRSTSLLAGISQPEQTSTSYARPHSLSAPASAAERVWKRQCVRTFAAAAAQPATELKAGTVVLQAWFSKAHSLYGSLKSRLSQRQHCLPAVWIS